MENISISKILVVLHRYSSSGPYLRPLFRHLQPLPPRHGHTSAPPTPRPAHGDRWSKATILNPQNLTAATGNAASSYLSEPQAWRDRQESMQDWRYSTGRCRCQWNTPARSTDVACRGILMGSYSIGRREVCGIGLGMVVFVVLCVR